MEVRSNGTAIGGLPMPHPDEALIRAQNARRIARRRQAAALALDVARVQGDDDLSRFGERRQVGGRFESLQNVPEREAPERDGLDLGDLGRFLGLLSFDPQEETLDQRSFFSSFGPFVLGLNN